MPDFYYFGGKRRGRFSPILVLTVLLSMPGTKQQLTKRPITSVVGGYDAVWVLRMDMKKVG